MKIDFRIDFGYQYLYSRRHYHPTYIWDGELSVREGAIEESYRLDYPVLWFGPGHSARETRLPSPSWKISTKRGVAGVRFRAEVSDGAVFRLVTDSFETEFSADDLISNGRLEYPVGPKYLGCHVIITMSGYLWFRQPLHDGETALGPYDTGLDVHSWHRMDLAWLAPGQSFSFEADIPEKKKDYEETLFHTVAMISEGYTPEKDTVAAGEVEIALFSDGELLGTYSKYYRYHDMYMQILEDDWKRVVIAPGKHTVRFENRSSFWFCLSSISYRQCGYDHGQLSLPEWVMKEEKCTGRVFAVREDDMTVRYGGKSVDVPCVPGWNEFGFVLSEQGDTVFTTETDLATVEVVAKRYDEDRVLVGYDMTVVPHDSDGFMDWLLDYTQRTRLGNFIMFRNFKDTPVPDELLYRWGEFCREHGMWVSACTDYLSGALIKGAGDMFSNCGKHEYPGPVYAADPAEPDASGNMKEAAEKYIAYLKRDIDEVHSVSSCAAFGDASGGIRYSFIAGADLVRAETMVGNSQTLLTQARPAAEALGKGEWGVHIAIQHNFQPYFENHLGQYFLSLMQPWMMGAGIIYEEDCLFEMFKEERMCWDDLLTKGKRDMTRSFYRFVSSYKRRGKNVRNIAFLEGRWAAPFNGFICDSEQDPHYSVWGLFGNSDPAWGHGQPEKCRQVLDVLMPGASTHPFRQRFDRRRMFFTGTPYGDFDCVPVESSLSYLENYSLIANLGWHTANEEDEEKLMKYVENGGVLLTGIPQFSTHTERDFLKDMEDLSLIHEGDLSAFSGIKVRGRGEVYSGQFNCADRGAYPDPVLSALPSDSPDEDGAAYLADVEMCGAELVAWDAASGKPVLVRNRAGEGWVYTLTFWAYPGHERFQTLSASVLSKLASEAVPDVYVCDATDEIFWTRWEDGDDTVLMLLNTDWTEKGNEKTAYVISGGEQTPFAVREREALILTVSDGKISEERVTL